VCKALWVEDLLGWLEGVPAVVAIRFKADTAADDLVIGLAVCGDAADIRGVTDGAVVVLMLHEMEMR
jgi:hypothetical protein